MFREILLFSSMAILASGCVSQEPRTDTDAGALEMSFVLGVERASYTQLTDDYAVTVDHVSHMVIGSVIHSDKVDIAFFRHVGVAPCWANAVLPEPVTMRGNPMDGWDYATSIAIGGIDVWPNRHEVPGRVIALQPWSGPIQGVKTYAPFDAVFVHGNAEHGYSGGPVVNAKNEVVGIISAIVSPPSGEYHYQDGDILAVPSATIWAEFRRLVPAQVTEAVR